MTQKSLKVEGITCQHCVQTISNSLKDRTGIARVEVNIDKKEVKVEYNEEKIKLIEISREIVALGFDIAKN